MCLNILEARAPCLWVACARVQLGAGGSYTPGNPVSTDFAMRSGAGGAVRNAEGSQPDAGRALPFVWVTGVVGTRAAWGTHHAASEGRAARGACALRHSPRAAAGRARLPSPSPEASLRSAQVSPTSAVERSASRGKPVGFAASRHAGRAWKARAVFCGFGRGSSAGP